MKNLKLYIADFKCAWPVGCGLIILAENEDRAMEIAKKTVTHTDILSVRTLPMHEGVVYYQSGEY